MANSRASFPHHEHLRLVNFTAFADASFDFVPGINAIIGTNGTGKTHLLKVLYSVQYDQYRTDRFEFSFLSDVMEGVLHANKISTLIRNQSAHFWLEGKWSSKHWEFGPIRPDENRHQRLIPGGLTDVPRPVFIPAVDMMGHTRRFVSTYDEYQIDFDQTHRDIVALLLSPEKRNGIPAGETATLLSKILGGELEEEGERFYLRTPQGRQPMPLVAEGLRKIATLYQLLRNGYLRPGDTLFWDEPEVSLSPLLMDEVIAVLLSLARSRVQIFLTTHSYVILKELDLQAQTTDSVRFFSLYPTPEGTQVETADNYAELTNNAIAEQFDSIYDRELTRAMGQKRK